MKLARYPVAVGVDIGGTFTDFVVFENDTLRIHKVPSTPDDPSRAFLRGLDDLGVRGPVRYVHGSTVATNAVLERRGARAGLLTTDGFRDILEIQRQQRLHLYALAPTKPLPLIPRERCFEVPERVGPRGEILEPLDPEAVERVLGEIVAAEVESLAVVFLFGFANPAHEQEVGRRAAARGLCVSLSSEILPEYREYERASTTAANAYVAPLMERYLTRLEHSLDARGPNRLQIMQSNGGVISAAAAGREAVRTLLSGPAGGIVGAWKVAAAAGFDHVITFDMGGTSTDVSLIEDTPLVTSEGSVSGLPIRVSMLDIHTVGAGGGSLARVDAGGALRVGPGSAGADPGPAAYGKGAEPTVTDANLVLGRLRPRSFLGGRLTLHPERAAAALTDLAQKLDLDLETTAAGVVRVADVQMARAARRVSVERGFDPRRFCLVAFGGGGPLHACAVAEDIGVSCVLVPRYPGALSALGMLLTDLHKENSRTVMVPLGDDTEALDDVFLSLEARTRAELQEEGVDEAQLRLVRYADVRYRGQSYELRLAITDSSSETLRAAFHAAHQRRFGYASPNAPCEIVHLRVRGTGDTPAPALPRAAPGPPAAPCETVPVFASGVWQPCPVYDRAALAPGQRLPGPALVIQEDTTTWIAPGWDTEGDEFGNLLMRRVLGTQASRPPEAGSKG